MIGLTSNNIELIIEHLIENRVGGEPIDQFSLCIKPRLLSALKTPFQRPDCKDEIETFIDRAARVYYSLIINHPLPSNGNKRLATQALLVLAYLNDFHIKTTEAQLYAFPFIVVYLSKYVRDKDLIFKEIEEFIRESLVERPNKILEKQKRILEAEFNDFLMTNE